MSRRLLFLGVAGILTMPGGVAAGEAALVDMPAWSVAPFALLLLCIALLPLMAGRFWHSNRNRAILAAGFAVPVAAFLIYKQLVFGQPTVPLLVHELMNYVSFILLLGSLYTVSGGIVLVGDLEPRPLTNAALLALGAVLANLIGTTGASMLLIRPFLRINRVRQNVNHLTIFFIFNVSNLGGLLTPLGDPPLFLGFLNGVPFAWTLTLWPHWLLVNGVVLTVFFIWDTIAYRREPGKSAAGLPKAKPLRLQGLRNLVFLAGIMAGVLLQGALPSPWGEIGGGLLMLVMGLLSLLLTPRGLRRANAFTWGPIFEVAILFAGIFVTMVPAMQLLSVHGPAFGLSKPWEFFWLTGALSAWLDNAPTYLTFATLAAGSNDFSRLVLDETPGLNGPLILQAISCGAVFMGAATYIGNGPNLMVKAIADVRGFRTPSFFAFHAYALLILGPVFVLVTFLFFWPK